MKTYLYVFEEKHEMESMRNLIVNAAIDRGGRVVFDRLHNTITESDELGLYAVKHWFVNSSIPPHALRGCQFDRVYISERVTRQELLDLIESQRKDKS